MNQQNDKNPHLDSSTIQQWVRQSAQQSPGAPLAEKEKTEEEIRSNRMEWIDVAASAFCLVLSVLLIFLNVTSKADNTLIRVFALLLPPLILILYYTKLLDQDTHSGTFGSAFFLLLSSMGALYTSISTGYTAYLNYFQFILPCIFASAFFLILNHMLKRKRNRYLALIIMIIWIPLYVPAFVTLLNLTMPSFSTKETASELYNTHYDGEGNYSVQVELEETGKILSFRVPRDIYDRVSYDSTSEITIQKGLLGIDYARLRLNHLEAPDSEEN